ncbi:hypothetical protein FHX71_003600 [Promicromonospora sukumoe]|uniref:Uncharacterized protein n=1 Tax=Promicromonospora sukumoe TaxID=88382 RepID=A0A7W3PFI4_9MICO|nr:hypothetical protein [Promicromonospora sukumoe]
MLDHVDPAAPAAEVGDLCRPSAGTPGIGGSCGAPSASLKRNVYSMRRAGSTSEKSQVDHWSPPPPYSAGARMATSARPPTRRSTSAAGQVNGPGPHHARRPSGVAHAAQARSTGPSRSRVTSTSNVSVMSCLQVRNVRAAQRTPTTPDGPEPLNSSAHPE